MLSPSQWRFAGSESDRAVAPGPAQEPDPGLTARVFEDDIVPGAFEPVLAKHSKNFSLQNALSIGVDSMQRNFKPMVESVEC